MDENVFREIVTGNGDTIQQATLNEMVVTVMGDDLSVYDTDYDGNLVVIGADTVRSYGGPFYDDLEGFIASCDGHCKIGMIETNIAGRILYIYDHRPEQEVTVWPDGSEIDPEDRGYYTGGNFCYAFNIDYPGMSEWGYAHEFPRAGEDTSGMLKRQQDDWSNTMKAIEEIGGAPPFVVDVGVRAEKRIG